MTKKRRKKNQNNQSDKTTKNPVVCGRASVLPTPEQLQKFKYSSEYVDSEGEPTTPDKGAKRMRRRDQSTLDLCLSRHLITEEQYEAGQQLFRDFMFSGLYRSTSYLPEIPTKSNGRIFSFPEGRAECLIRYNYVLKKLGRYAKIARNVCCFSATVETLECYGGWLNCSDDESLVWIDEQNQHKKDKKNKKKDAWPRRSGKVILSLVLDDMVDIYKGIDRYGMR